MLARYLAKNIVASGIADKCLLQIAYAIGVAEPISIYLDIFQDNQKLVEQIIKVIQSNFDLSPRGIRNKLELNQAYLQKNCCIRTLWKSPD